MPQCKCADCGLLGRYHSETQQLCEIDPESRRNGSKLHGFNPLPVCSVGKIEFHEECVGKDLKQVLHQPRDCDKFYKWSRGLNPKEHKQMISDERLELIARETKERDLAFQKNQRFWDRTTQFTIMVVNVLLTAVMTAVLVWLGFKKL